MAGVLVGVVQLMQALQFLPASLEAAKAAWPGAPIQARPTPRGFAISIADGIFDWELRFEGEVVHIVMNGRFTHFEFFEDGGFRHGEYIDLTNEVVHELRRLTQRPDLVQQGTRGWLRKRPYRGAFISNGTFWDFMFVGEKTF